MESIKRRDFLKETSSLVVGLHGISFLGNNEKLKISDINKSQKHRKSRPFTEDEKRELADYNWATYNKEIQQEYERRIVAVYNRKIFGDGANDLEALQHALEKPNCPQREYLVLVPIHGGLLI